MATEVAPSRSSAPRLCRVALLVGADTLIDYALPAAVPLIAVIEDLIPRVNDILRASDVTPLDGAASYQLCRCDAAPLDPQMSLDDAGVVDGDSLWLLPTEATERFGPVIEEVSTALARSARAQFSRVDETTARQVATGLCVGLLVFAELLLVRQWLYRGGWVPATVSWALAALWAVGAWLASRAVGEQRRRTSGGFAWSALIAAGAGAAMAVPGHLGGWHVVAAISTVVAAAATLTMLTGRYVTVLAAMAVALGSAAAVAAIHASGWQLRPEQIAVTALAAMLAVVTFATNIAVVGAGVPGPWFPSVTNRGVFENRPGAPLDTVSPVEPSGAVPAAQIAVWARRGNQIVTGLLSGCAIVVVVAAGYAVVPGKPGGWRFAAFTLGVCLILVLRARSFVDRYQSAVLAISAVLGVALVIGRYAATPYPPSLSATLLGAAATLGLAVLGWLAAMVIPTARINAPTNRAVEVTEYIVLIFVVPWLLWLLNVLSAARNLVHGS
uniref:ESX-1 secretion system protein eccD1 n=1 Tax=Mycobacterium riyadhense TaxID=486698 RepID=A0A653EXP5_9MYCO|nr:ESX-1 secretion system protein eccD1 [Mycobacterium riyadhense]